VSRSEAERLARERADARASRDYARADGLRERIRGLGFEVVDTADGFALRPLERAAPASTPVHRSADDVPSALDDPATADVSVHWLVQGWPEDVARGIASFGTSGDVTVRHLVVEAWDGDFAWPDFVQVVRVGPELGWAAARNAGLRRSVGRVVVVADGSVEARGDALTPLVAALEDEAVGVTGPFGIVTDDLREFRESPGPNVDAIEGYLMAFRRDMLRRGVWFDRTFKFYRTADIELSFQIKALGLRAVVTDVPVVRHEHRIWSNTPEDERARLSKRNFYRFLDRWRGRDDLLARNAAPA
jgi:cysteinyl-tRNA synthetase